MPCASCAWIGLEEGASGQKHSSRTRGPTGNGIPGAMKYELPLGADAEARYGAPYLLMHRGDLHEGLVSSVAVVDLIERGKKLIDLDRRSGGVELRLPMARPRGRTP